MLDLAILAFRLRHMRPLGLLLATPGMAMPGGILLLLLLTRYLHHSLNLGPVWAIKQVQSHFRPSVQFHTASKVLDTQ